MGKRHTRISRIWQGPGGDCDSKEQWFMAPAANPAPTDGTSGKSEMSL